MVSEGRLKRTFLTLPGEPTKPFIPFPGSLPYECIGTSFDEQRAISSENSSY